jgi:hypothetical protein
MALPKWDEARLAQLVAYVGNEEPVSIQTVNAAAVELETTARSIAAKLRKEGYDVEKSATVATKTFTEEQEDALREFLVKNSGDYTFAEIAAAFANGAFSAKQIQGKVLSMELTDAVKPTEKKVYERTFNDKEQAIFIKMANDDAFLEDIASKLNRTVPSVRGKALSLLRTKEISAIPASKNVAKVEDAFEGLDLANMTVAEISVKVDRSERGVKTMLTRRGVDAKDYSGAAKAAKNAAKA